MALPLDMFYNTGIATYIWVLSNRKLAHRRGKVQLIDATQWFQPLRKNLGAKNCELSAGDIQRICDFGPVARMSRKSSGDSIPVRCRMLSRATGMKLSQVSTMSSSRNTSPWRTVVPDGICKAGTRALMMASVPHRRTSSDGYVERASANRRSISRGSVMIRTAAAFSAGELVVKYGATAAPVT